MNIDLSELTKEQLQQELVKRENQREELRKDYKQIIEEIIPVVFNQLLNASAKLSQVKGSVFTQLSDILKMKEEAYGIKDKQRSHTFTTKDGKSITIGYRINDDWDDTVGAGVAKINEWLEGLAKDEDTAKLVRMIGSLLKKDKEGKLKSSRVLELQKIKSEINNPLFSDGVDIIIKSYKPVRSVFFIEAKFKNDINKDVSIPLSISSVDFPEGIDLSFFNNLK